MEVAKPIVRLVMVEVAEFTNTPPDRELTPDTESVPPTVALLVTERPVPEPAAVMAPSANREEDASMPPEDVMEKRLVPDEFWI